MLERIVQALEERLARLFGREEPADDLALRREALATATERREALRRLLGGLRRREEELTAEVAAHLRGGRSARAYEAALGLERLRQGAQEAKAQLPRLEQLCWSLEFDIRQQERKRQQAPTEVPVRRRGNA